VRVSKELTRLSTASSVNSRLTAALQRSVIDVTSRTVTWLVAGDDAADCWDELTADDVAIQAHRQSVIVVNIPAVSNFQNVNPIKYSNLSMSPVLPSPFLPAC